MSRSKEGSVVKVNKIWTAHVFKRLYEDVLDKGRNIRVRNIRDDGAYELETYVERGLWMFKTRIPLNVYLLEPGKTPICINTIKS